MDSIDAKENRITTRLLTAGIVGALVAALLGDPVQAAPVSLNSAQAYDSLVADAQLAGFAGVTNDGCHLTLW